MAYQAILTDTFNRADESPIGAPWVSMPQYPTRPNLTGNAVRSPSTSFRQMHRGGEATFANDQYQAVDWYEAAPLSASALHVRYNAAAQNGYFCGFYGGQATIYRIDGGTYTLLAAAGATLGALFEAVGTTIRNADRTGVSTLVSATDATYSSGDPTGVQTFWNGGGFDNWEAGNVGAATSGALIERGLVRGAWRGVGRGV